MRVQAHAYGSRQAFVVRVHLEEADTRVILRAMSVVRERTVTNGTLYFENAMI